MNTFKIRYFESKEHFEAEADEWVKDTFYTIGGAEAKAEDLLYRNIKYRVEVYNTDNKLKPILILNQSNFNRNEYRKYQKNGTKQ